MSEQLRREGDDLQRLLDEVHDEFGPTVQILSASKTRVGGVLGFFASQRYVVLAQLPEAASGAVRAATPVTSAPVAPAARPAAIDNVEDPGALAGQILPVGEEPAVAEQATPEQAFAAALARAVALQASQESPAEVDPPAAPPEVAPELAAAPAEAPARPAVEAAVEDTVKPAVEDTVKPAVFTRIARPTEQGPSTQEPVEAADLPAARTGVAPRAVRPPGSRPSTGDVVAVIGDVEVIRSEAIALLRRWKMPTDALADPATQASLALAMEGSQALVVTGPTPGLVQPDQLDDQRWARWRNADVPVVILIPTAALTRAGSRRLADQLVALGADRVLAVVDARDETENLRHWLRGFPGVRGLLAHHVGAARNPTDVAQLGLPVVGLDGRAATAARWRTYFRSETPSAGRAASAQDGRSWHRVGAR